MAEIILEPTVSSKVIPLTVRPTDVDHAPTGQLVTNKQFNTADTDAWFRFTLDGLGATTGSFKLTLINLQDKSVFNHSGLTFATNPFYYKLDSSSDETKNEIRHAGRWVGQLVVTLANGDSATRKFIFDIEGHILDGTVIQTILLEDYNALIATITGSKDELLQYNIDYATLIADVTTAKETMNQAEITRQITFDALVDSEMIAQNVEIKLTEKERTYEPRLLAAEQQLAETQADLQAAMGALTADSEVVTARNSTVKGKTFSVLDSRFEELEADVVTLKSKAVKQYGIRRTLNASSTLLERLNDGIGLVANVPTDDGTAQNDFDAVYPFNQIKECIIDATGRIHYKGDPTYAAAIGDWMVEVPLYYVKDVRTATTQDEYFSAFKLDGYRIPKDFIREDGTVCQKVYYGRFKTGKDGTTDVSRPGLVPSNYRDLASFRTGARAKGAGWQEVGINYVKDFLHKLTKVEFANLNSQTVFGPGITSARYTATDTAVIAGTAVNRFVTTIAIASNFNVGNVINIGTTLGGNNVASMRVITAINALDASNSEIVFDGAAVNIAIGNIIAMVAQKTGQTANLQKPSGKLSGISGRTSFKWRGIEDPFGNLYEWVDGVLINDNKGYICNKPSLFASTLTADYKPLSYINANANGYPFEMGYDENYPEAQFPIAVGAGSSTGYADYYYQNTGLRGAFFGGDATDGTFAGLFYWPLGDSPSVAAWGLGGRLLFKPPAV